MRTLFPSLSTAGEMTPAGFNEAQKRRGELQLWCNGLFEDYDILVTPTVAIDPPPARGPFPAETEGRKQIEVVAGAFTIPFNLSWNPAASVRVGMSRAGLPIGMQIVGPRHRDDLVLQLSYAFEQSHPWHPEWPVDL